MRNHFPLSAVVMLILISCDAQEGATDRASGFPALLSATDSLLIGEHDEAYIGDPFSLIVADDPAGQIRDIWVSDLFANLVWHVDGSGHFVGRVGAPGPGPAEFRAPALAFLDEGNAIGVSDMRAREIKWFDRDSGGLLRTSRYSTGRLGWSRPFPADTIGTTVVFAMNDPTAATSLALFDASIGAWHRQGSLAPRHRGASRRGQTWFPAFFPYFAAAPHGPGRVLIAFGGDDTLLRHQLDDETSEHVGLVPRRFRRGVDHPCVELSDLDLANAQCPPPFDLFSSMQGLWKLADGRHAIVHVDQESSGSPPNRVLTGQIFLSVLDLEADQACVDLRVPGGGDARPVFDVLADALYVLDRRIEEAESRTWLLRFPIPPRDGCPPPHRVQAWTGN